MKKLFAMLLAALCLLASLSPALAEETTGQILATVNGVDIPSAEAEAMYADYYAYYISAGASEEDIAMLAEDVANYFVVRELLNQKGAELGYGAFTEEERAALEQEAGDTYERMVRYYMEAIAEETAEQLDEGALRSEAVAFLTDRNYTLQALIDSTIENELMKRTYDYATRDLTVSEEAVQATYEEWIEEDRAAYEGNPAYYEAAILNGVTPNYVPEGLRLVKHILIMFPSWDQTTLATHMSRLEEIEGELAAPGEDTDADALAAEREQLTAEVEALYATLLPTAEEVLSRLEAGEEFEALLAEYGEDPGMQQGEFAVSGYPVSQDSGNYDPAFTAGSMALAAPGDVSEPIRSSFGLHIIRYESDLPAGPVALEELQDTLVDNLMAEEGEAAYYALLDSWYAESKIELHLDVLTTVE